MMLRKEIKIESIETNFNVFIKEEPAEFEFRPVIVTEFAIKEEPRIEKYITIIKMYREFN